MEPPTLDGDRLPLPDPRRPDGRLVAYSDFCTALRRMIAEYGEEDTLRLAEFLLVCVASGQEFPI